MATDFTIIRGDDEDLVVTIVDSAGDAYDLTGCVLFFTMKENPEDLDANALIMKTLSGTDLTAPATGIQTIALADTDTDDLIPKDYYYDIQLKDASGKIHSTPKGIITVAQDVTLRIG